ncbi:MAG: hypothetical protein ABI321_02050 [Polyangia bacterium]
MSRALLVALVDTSPPPTVPELIDRVPTYAMAAVHWNGDGDLDVFGCNGVTQIQISTFRPW